jgi:hypothetical protein
MSEGYRLIQLRRVTADPCTLTLEIVNCPISLVLPRKDLARYGIETLTAGQWLWIKGRSGNADHQLWGFDPVADLKEYT